MFFVIKIWINYIIKEVDKIDISEVLFLKRVNCLLFKKSLKLLNVIIR